MPTSQKYFEKEKFIDVCLHWKEIYMIPRIVSSNTWGGFSSKF